jgi:hypothetical protein
MPYLFVVADQECSCLEWFDASIVECFDRSNKVSYAGFIVQVAGANEPIGNFHTGIESHEISNLDA